VATTLTVFRPLVALLAAALVLAVPVPPTNAQTTPTSGNTFELGLLGDPGEVFIFSATTTGTAAPVNLYVFDDDGRPVVGNSGVAITTTVAQLPQGTHYLAIWNGSTAPVPAPGFQIGNFIPAQEFDLNIDAPRFGGTIRCPDLAGNGVPIANECLRDITFYSFYVGEPTSQRLDRALTSKATGYDISLVNATGNPRFGVYNEAGERVSGQPPEFYSPGRYFIAVGADLQTNSFGFLVRLRESNPVTFNLAIGGFDFRFFDLASDEILWLEYEVRDEGPDTVVSGDFTELEPIEIFMTRMGVGSIALFRASNGDLIDLSSNVFDARLDPTPVLEAGDYLVAANANLVSYADNFFTLAPVFSEPQDYSLTIGRERFLNQTIEPGGETDFYRFTVEPTPNLGEIAEGPQAFTVETASADPTRDTELALYSDDGMLLFEDDNGGAGSLSKLEVAGGLPAGSYVVAVAGADTVFADDFVTQVNGDEDTGDYALEYIGLSDQSDLGFGGDVDMYRFEIGIPTDLGELGGSGDSITLNTFGSQFNTALAVWDENGTLLETSDVPAIGLDSIERVYASGVYHFGVAGSGATFADGFRINVASAGPLGNYSGVAGVLLYDGTTSELNRFDLFRFEIAEACNAADVAMPFGVLDLDDVDGFISAFLVGGAAADIAEPLGILDLDDVDGFISLFLAGCP